LNASEILSELKALTNTKSAQQRAAFKIGDETAFGVRLPDIRALAKKISRNHSLALELWDTKIHEARILASMIADPNLFTKEIAYIWAEDFNSWDLCDQCCMNLLRKTAFAYENIYDFLKSNNEFTLRASFTLIATLAVHDKSRDDKTFVSLFPLIEEHSEDPRNFVKKAVNWAIRQIGKRNSFLKKEALLLCGKLLKKESKSAHWIAKDALRELNKK
jgi:3-methyladenine DNA glycosylase AlkD